MGFRLCLIFLVLATAIVAESSSFNDVSFGGLPNRDADDIASCNGGVGECIGDDNEMMLDSDISRRLLAARKKHISYGALRANQVPCNRRGQSYYNCNKRQKANPYRRGCSAITRCARHLD